MRNIQIDGNREGLGYLSGGAALMEMGGANTGQTIDNVKAYEPRGWSCLHGIGEWENLCFGVRLVRRLTYSFVLLEGTNLACRGMQITNNQIGPSGEV